MFRLLLFALLIIQHNWNEAPQSSELDTQTTIKHQIHELTKARNINEINRIINEHPSLDVDFTLKVLTQNLTLAQQDLNQNAQAYTYLSLGNFWFSQSNRVKAFDYYLQSELISRQNNFSSITGLAIMNRSALVLEPEERIRLLKEAIPFFQEESDLLNLAKAHLNIGSAYSNMVLNLSKQASENINDSSGYDTINTKPNVGFLKNTAFFHLKNANEINNSLQHNEIFASLNVNYAQWAEFENDLAAAEEFYNTALRYFSKAGVIRGQVYVTLQVAKIKYQQKKYAQALNLLRQIEQTAISFSINNYLVGIYELMVAIYEEIGNYKQALEYQKIYTSSWTKYNELVSHDKIHALNLEYTLLDQNRKIDVLNKDKKIDRLLLLLIALSTLLIILFSVTIFMRKQRRIEAYKKSIEETEKLNRIQKSLMESRLNNQKLQKELLEAKVQSRSENLIQFSNQVQKLESFIENFTSEIKTFLVGGQDEKWISKFNSLKHPLTQIVQEQKNLKEISILSEQANQDFFFYLEQKYGTINKSDKKLLSLLILDMNSKEISEYFNISIESVNKKRYRLRKKLDIPKGNSFIDFYKETLPLS